MVWQYVATGAEAGKLLGIIDPALRAMGAWANYLWPNNLPPVDEAYDAWRQGFLSAENLYEICRCHGVGVPQRVEEQVQGADAARRQTGQGYWRSWRAIWETRKAWIGSADVIQSYLQQFVNHEHLTDRLIKNRIYDLDDREILLKLAENKLPSPGELVSFALREAWDPVTVQRFEYDSEFPREFRAWMRAQGADGDARPIIGGERQGPEVTWSQLYWRVHWANISPGQANEMFQRLRPNRIDRFGPALAGLRPFTFNDLTQVLKINDYPIPFRPQLAAIAYRKPRLVDIDRFFRSGQIDENEVFELHQDLGYAPTDARMRTNWLIQTTLQSPQSKAARRLPARIVELYKLGRLTRDQAKQRLLAVLTAGRVALAVDASNLPATDPTMRLLVAEAEAYLTDAELSIEIDAAHVLRRAWERQFLHGQIDADQLRESMTVAGYTPASIKQFLATMLAELASGRLLLSTERVKKLFARGIIDIAVATRYLTNLGWKNPELSYLLREMERDHTLNLERQIEREEKEVAGRTRSLIRQAQLQQQARDRTIRSLNRQSSEPQLKRYFVRGILSERDYDRELERRGKDDEARKRAIQDARIERERYLAKQRGRLDAGGNGEQLGGVGRAGAGGIAP